MSPATVRTSIPLFLPSTLSLSLSLSLIFLIPTGLLDPLLNLWMDNDDAEKKSAVMLMPR